MVGPSRFTLPSPSGRTRNGAGLVLDRIPRRLMTDSSAMCNGLIRFQVGFGLARADERARTRRPRLGEPGSCVGPRPEPARMISRANAMECLRASINRMPNENIKDLVAASVTRILNPDPTFSSPRIVVTRVELSLHTRLRHPNAAPTRVCGNIAARRCSRSARGSHVFGAVTSGIRLSDRGYSIPLQPPTEAPDRREPVMLLLLPFGSRRP